MSILLQTTSADAVNVADSAKVVISQIAQDFVQNPNAVLSSLAESAVQFGLKVVAALLIYAVGAWIIRKIKRLLRRIFLKKRTEPTLASFVMSLVTISLTVLLVIITISTLGINTTSLAAVLAAGGMAIGMALSGTVQNFAGGIMILIFKPFKAGDFINAQGYSGTVMDVSIVSTKIQTVDNRIVILPNGALSNGNIDNYSQNKFRRVDLTISFSYGVDADELIKAMKELVSEDARVLDSSTPGAQDPFIAINNLGASSVDFTVRLWVDGADYWGVYFDTQRRIYTNMPKKGFSFPFPQLDVHLKNEN